MSIMQEKIKIVAPAAGYPDVEVHSRLAALQAQFV